MQDISRDNLSILNGGDASAHSTDKDMCPIQIFKNQITSPLSSSATNLPKDSNGDNSEIQSFISVKVEDINTVDLFPSNSTSWQQYQIHDLGDHRLCLNSCNSFDRNNTKLLLQGSDDPLISHGANSVVTNDDEHPADFAKSFITHANNYLQNTVNKKDNQERLSKLLNEEKSSQRPVKSGCSNLTKQQLKVKANLMSARNQQQQQQQQSQNTTSPPNTSTASATTQNIQRTQKTKNKKGTAVKLRFHHQALPPEYLSHYEATQGQQRMCKNQSNLKMSNQRNSSKTTNNFQRQSQPRNSHENVRSWLQKIAEIQRTANASKKIEASQTQNPLNKNLCQTNAGNTFESQNSLNSISVDDNNNYKMQTVSEMQNKCSLPHSSIQDVHFLAEFNNRSSSKRSNYADLPYMGEMILDNCKPRRGRKPKKADICHLIYKNYGTILPQKTKPDNCSNYTSNLSNIKNHCFVKDSTIEQPLNLCLRDQMNDSFSISSGDELSDTNSTCPTPVSTPFDYMRDSMLANNLEKSLNNISEQNENQKALNMPKQSVLPESGEKLTHPMTMCYKKILESGVLLHNTNGRYKTVKKDNQLAIKIPMSSGLFQPQIIEKSASSPVELHSNNPEPLSTSLSMQSEKSLVNTKSLIQNQQLIGPQKRKRSAIFIPPMNVENSNNPATEVSICKFKFTGGSNPSLQEKKMISVDAGGNYSYFSGTGDKASRGYEYFPRESLQHTAGLLPGVNCTGRKLCIEMPPVSQGPSNSNSESSTSTSGRSMNVSMDSVSPNTTITPYEVSKNEACSLSIKENSSYSSSSPITLTANLQLKKNDAPHQLRKFSQKEKLEQTFKKQGFLIQTQQIESAEGATYCKFRQLKKLTRYLFRNWKDYLPNDIQEKTNIATFTSKKDSSLRLNEYMRINAIKQPSTNSL